MVLVRDAWMSSEGWRDEAHSLQNLESSGLSVLHCGHFVAIIDPNCRQKDIKSKEMCQMGLFCFDQHGLVLFLLDHR